MAYGYKGDTTGDSASLAGTGDRDNQLFDTPDHQSVALTVEGRKARFGVEGHSTGLPFTENGKTYYDDDTAPTTFVFNGQVRHNSPDLIDVYDPNHPPDKLSLSSGYAHSRDSDNAHPTESYLPPMDTETVPDEPLPEPKPQQPEDKGAQLLAPQTMVQRIRQLYPGKYGSLDDQKLWDVFKQKYPTGLKQIQALYPEYKKVKESELLTALKKEYFPHDTEDEFIDRINPPSGINGVMHSIGEQLPSIIPGWYDATAQLAKFPTQAAQFMQDVVNKLGIKVESKPYAEVQGPNGQMIKVDAAPKIDPGQEIQTGLTKWAQRQSQRGSAYLKKHRIPTPHDLSGSVAQKAMYGLGYSPAILPAFLPGEAVGSAGAAMVFGMMYDAIGGYGKAREKGLDNAMEFGAEGFTYRALQEWFLHTPRGRLLSGLLWAAGGVADAEAQKFLTEKTLFPKLTGNTLNDLVSTAAVNAMFGSIFSTGLGKGEVFEQAKAAREAGDYAKAAQLLDRTTLLLPDKARQTAANNLLAWRNEAIEAKPGDAPAEQPGERGFQLVKPKSPELNAPKEETAGRDAITDEFYYSGIDIGRMIPKPVKEAAAKIPREAQKHFEPETISEQSRVAGAIISEQIGIKQRQSQSLITARIARMKLGNKLRFAYDANRRASFWLSHPKGEVMNMMEAHEAGHTTGNKVADGLLKIRDTILKDIAQMDQTRGFTYDLRDSYFYGLFKKKEDFEKFEADVKRMQWGDPRFMKPKEIPTLAMARKLGYELKWRTPEEEMQMRLDASLRAEQQAATLEGLRAAGLAYTKEGLEALPEKMQEQFKAQTGPSAWRSPRPPNDMYWVQKDADFMLHRALDPLNWKPEWAGPIVNGLNAVKQRTVGLNLALSGYHHLHMLPIGASDTITLAMRKWIEGTATLGDWGKALGDFASMGLFNQVESLYHNQGLLAFYEGKKTVEDLSPHEREALQWQQEGGFVPRMSHEREIQLTRYFMLKANKYARGADKALDFGYMLLSGRFYQNWLFRHAIPSLKQFSFDRQAAALFESKPWLLRPEFEFDRKVALRNISKLVDGRFGERNLEQDFTEAHTKALGQALMLSYSWNRSFVDVYGGGIHDLSKVATHFDEVLKAAKEEGLRPAAERYLTQKAVYAMTLTGMSLIAGGLISLTLGTGIHDLQDLLYPNIGTDDKGQLKRVKPPFWVTTEFGGWHHDTEMFDTSLPLQQQLQGTWLFATNKMQPGLAALYKAFVTGKDYNGNDIASPYDPSDPWNSFLSSTWDRVEFAATQMAPFALQQGYFQAKPGTDARDIILMHLGLPPAPQYAERSHVENLIIEEYGNYIARKGRTKHAADQLKAIEAYRSALNSDDEDAIQSARDKLSELGMSEKAINAVKASKDQTTAERVWHAIGKDSIEGKNIQEYILRQMSPEEREHFLPLARKDVQAEAEQ